MAGVHLHPPAQVSKEQKAHVFSCAWDTLSEPQCLGMFSNNHLPKPPLLLAAALGNNGSRLSVMSLRHCCFTALAQLSSEHLALLAYKP